MNDFTVGFDGRRRRHVRALAGERHRQHEWQGEGGPSTHRCSTMVRRPQSIKSRVGSEDRAERLQVAAVVVAAAALGHAIVPLTTLADAVAANRGTAVGRAEALVFDTDLADAVAAAAAASSAIRGAG